MTGGGADRGTNNVANAVSLAFHHHRSKRRKGHLEITMAGILIGYAVAIAIVFFASRPFSNKSTTPKGMVPSAGGTADRPIGQWSGKCEELILGYFALTAV